MPPSVHQLRAVLFRGRPYSYAGVPLDQFVQQSTHRIQLLCNYYGKTQNTPDTLNPNDINNHYRAFYVLTFNIDGRKIVKVGVAENPIKRMHDYLVSYGTVERTPQSPLQLRTRQVAREPVHAGDAPPNTCTGVYVHLMLMTHKSATRVSYDRDAYVNKNNRAVQKLEAAVKLAFAHRKPVPTRGNERFEMPVKELVQYVLRNMRNYKDRSTSRKVSARAKGVATVAPPHATSRLLPTSATKTKKKKKSVIQRSETV